MSENISNGVSEPKDVEGAKSRIRTQSECSINSDEGGVNISGKRQRTTSQTYMVTSAISSASPPKFVTLEEIMQAANGMKDMALVHQIVVDKDFKLKRYEPEENSVQKMIKDTMTKAFWDTLRTDIVDDPPNYEHALVLLSEIKQSLLDLLLERQVKFRQQISEVLDIDLIKQQAEKEVLDFRHYAQFIISVMGKMCAPVRDEKIKELSTLTDIVDIFRGILETLDLMALDMANFTIEMAKPELIAQSVQLERKKFEDYLAIAPDGLEFTKKWLLKYLDQSVEKPEGAELQAFVLTLTKDTIIKATSELLQWDYEVPYPETYMLDVERLQDLQRRTEQMIVTGTILLIIMSNVGNDLNTLADFKKTIKDHCLIIMESYKTKKDLVELLPNISLQMIKDINTFQEKHGILKMSESNEKALTSLIADVASDDHKIKQLVSKRIREFFQQVVGTATVTEQKVPVGLSVLEKELCAIAGQFLKIVSHNSIVFFIYYHDIVLNALPQPA